MKRDLAAAGLDKDNDDPEVIRQAAKRHRGLYTFINMACNQFVTGISILSFQPSNGSIIVLE